LCVKLKERELKLRVSEIEKEQNRGRKKRVEERNCVSKLFVVSLCLFFCVF
jgi:hypothetical protein